ncbi:YceK/YidQ family lipoprotein [Candidatus Uabimicrobium sp. HlEnr_7]|uniref:YceK/YidQ family lipoprotein n=1 Tax=Candidatus Uabimicrobium helgolandensis TaxID=3095367 RepID=UPI0035561AC6
MKYLIKTVIACVFIFVVLGCGTVQSQTQKIDILAENPDYIGPFSGIVYDGKWAVCNPLRIVDLPLSLAADFVIMPYTIYRANEKCRLEKCDAPE